ncbi:predicted protein [Histoplasma capsulatum G186AR]|uniref:Uncharacterized protein n=1 Tax=Ajellomyces capsulatus (strain G186AR / H82 / ATCC MYA-2454 / RMSCC 2432) TaxID=447093 RepID=C0NH31_AJECG|nr:uncharacterized protein HCBG_02653 [Histoplasma capsulatum G186AR]EEH09116.1 predicted protein [Histoplasma capsulatum G186AR]
MPPDNNGLHSVLVQGSLIKRGSEFVGYEQGLASIGRSSEWTRILGPVQLPGMVGNRWLPTLRCTPESQEDFDTSAFNRRKADPRKPRLTIRNKHNLDSMFEEPEFKPPLSSQGLRNSALESPQLLKVIPEHTSWLLGQKSSFTSAMLL